MKLKPIGIESQIENCLFGISPKESEDVALKVAFATKNVNSIIAINGKKVFNPIVIGNDVFYWLSKPPKWFEVTTETKRKYYYPIQYAEITFFNNNTP